MCIFRKVWKDPVISKIIAAIILPYILVLIVAIKGFFNDHGYTEELKEIALFRISVPLWLIPIIIYITILLTLQFKRLKVSVRTLGLA